MMDCWEVLRVHLENHMTWSVIMQKFQMLQFSYHLHQSHKLISRRVSLVHYPEPSELEKQNTSHQNQMYQRSSGTSLTNSSHCFATHTQSTRPRSSKSSGSNAASMRSSKYTSSLSEIGEPSKPPKRKHIEEPTRSMDQFTQDSGRGHSVVTSSGSLEQSNDRKSRKKKKLVE